MYLFNNMYHPDVLDKVYQEVRATTWHHNIHDQHFMTHQYPYSGMLSDFTKDYYRDKALGFPDGCYAYFIPTRLVTGDQKYILTHFIKNREMFTFREMLKNPHFTEQYIFHFADYVFMDIKCMVTQTGTWLIIPINETDGISSEMIELMMSGFYGGDYVDNRWFIEKRTKVSYGYRESQLGNIIVEGNRIYMDTFPEIKSYYKEEASDLWKICISDREKDPRLMRMTTANLVQGPRPYFEMSENFVDYISKATFKVNTFVYHEGDWAGRTICPNYIGPSGFLFTRFKEYIAAVDSARLKVAVEFPNEEGWLTSSLVDLKFPEEDTVYSGFINGKCWMAIPTKDGVAPVHPNNFRVYEYDWERDTIGRMIAVNVVAQYPNIYIYETKTDCEMVLFEWYRDDHTVPAAYDDITYDYRQYTKQQFYVNAINQTLPAVIQNYEPHIAKFSATDFVKNVLLESSHDYRVQEMVALMRDTGEHYRELFEALNDKNRRYRSYTIRLKDNPALHTRIMKTGMLKVVSSGGDALPYDLYVDGLHISNTHSDWIEFDQYITVPLELITPTTEIIVDVYETADQTITSVDISKGINNALIHPSYGIKEISGSDLVIAYDDNRRVPLDKIKYGVYAREIVVQVPVNLVDWDELGISPDDSRLNIGVSDDGFKAVIFHLIVPMDSSYVDLITSEDAVITDFSGGHIKVKAGEVYLFNPTLFAEDDAIPRDETGTALANRFTRRVRTSDLVLGVQPPVPTTKLKVFNCNVYRMVTNYDLNKTGVVTMIGFAGADDVHRFLAFVDGCKLEPSALDGTIPEMVGDDLVIEFHGSDKLVVTDPGYLEDTSRAHLTVQSVYDDFTRGDVVYLPFPTDYHTFTSDANGWCNLAGTGIMCLCKDDIIFSDGKRVSAEDFISVTNQLVKAKLPDHRFELIRLRRDSNLYDFEDVALQSFTDKLMNQSPGFSAYIKSKY